MNTIKLSVSGSRGKNIDLSATYSDLRQFWGFLMLAEYRLYSEGPEWLIELYEELDEQFGR